MRRTGRIGRRNLVVGVIAVAGLAGGLLWTRSSGDDTGPAAAASEAGETGSGRAGSGTAGGDTTVEPADASTSGGVTPGDGGSSPPPGETTTTTEPTATTTSIPPAGAIELSTANLDFGQVQVGSSVEMSVTIANVSELRVVLDFPPTSGSGSWAISNDCPLSLGSGESCRLSTVFQPSGPGGYSYAYRFSYRVLDGREVFKRDLFSDGEGVDRTTGPAPTTPPATVPSGG